MCILKYINLFSFLLQALKSSLKRLLDTDQPPQTNSSPSCADTVTETASSPNMLAVQTVDCEPHNTLPVTHNTRVNLEQSRSTDCNGITLDETVPPLQLTSTVTTTHANDNISPSSRPLYVNLSSTLDPAVVSEHYTAPPPVSSVDQHYYNLDHILTPPPETNADDIFYYNPPLLLETEGD